MQQAEMKRKVFYKKIKDSKRQIVKVYNVKSRESGGEANFQGKNS